MMPRREKRHILIVAQMYSGKMDFKAQVSFEYLLTAMFGIILAIAAAIIIETVRSVALNAQAELLEIREKTIASLI